jgi:hypothetical protein
MTKTDSITSLLFDRPSRPVLAHVMEGNARTALVRLRGNDQRRFYEVIKYAISKLPVACFRSMNDAIAFAEVT